MTCVVPSEWVVSVGLREGCIDLVDSDVVVVIIGPNSRIVETGVDVVLHRKCTKAKGVSTVEIGYNQWVEDWAR